jgi:tRNA(His) 5'-end guanylyltransferase
MITYKWTISAFDCKAVLEDLTDVVCNVHWRYEATKNDIVVSTYGVLILENPNKDNFIALNDLKETDVIGWLESKLDVNELNTNLENEINLIEKPTEVKINSPFIKE